MRRTPRGSAPGARICGKSLACAVRSTRWAASSGLTPCWRNLVTCAVTSVKITLKRGDVGFVAEGRSVAGEHEVEIQFLEGVESGDPFIEIRIAHVGELALH